MTSDQPRHLGDEWDLTTAVRRLKDAPIGSSIAVPIDRPMLGTKEVIARSCAEAGLRVDIDQRITLDLRPGTYRFHVTKRG